MTTRSSMAESTPKPKRVLLLNQFYWPDGAPTAILLDDLARTFAANGWHVTVICGRSAYVRTEGKSAPPVEILSVPTFPYNRNPIGRILSWCSFLLSATARSFVETRFDLVIAMTSPPGIGWAGALHKILRATDFWIWEMDVYPDIAVALNGSEKSMFASVLSRAFDAMRRRADGIVVLGRCMQERLETHNISPERLFIAENWADGDAIRPSELPGPMPLTLLYSGNLGMAHDSGTIGNLLRQFANSPNFSFVFSGGGARRADLQNLCATEQIKNVFFQGYADKNGFVQNLASCHLGLVTLRPECVGAVVPSKVYSFLAAGRPFIYIGPKSATPALISQEGCGWSFENGDVQGVAALLQELSLDFSKLQSAAKQARRLFEKRYTTQLGPAKVFDLITSQSSCERESIPAV